MTTPSDSKMVIFGQAFLPIIKEIQKDLTGIDHFILAGTDKQDGMLDYEDLVAKGSPAEPGIYVEDLTSPFYPDLVSRQRFYHCHRIISEATGFVVTTAIEKISGAGL